jgi:putative transposase
MRYLLLAQIVCLLLDLCALARRSQRDQDRESLLLRQQLRILPRHHPPTPRVARGETFAVAVLAGKLVGLGRNTKTKLHAVLLLFQPATVLRWHRALVRRKWTFTQPRKAGRPATDPQVQELLLRLAHENPTWGYGARQGELLKLGHERGRATIRDLLKRQPGPPAPERSTQGSNWGTFLRH